MTWREAFRRAYDFLVIPGERRPHIGWRTAVVAVIMWIMIIGIGYYVWLVFYNAFIK